MDSVDRELRNRRWWGNVLVGSLAALGAGLSLLVPWWFGGPLFLANLTVAMLCIESED